MAHTEPHSLDVELTSRDVQSLDGPDAVAGFLARLGYNTDARTVQTAENLGIGAEGTLRPIRRIELLADQEGLFQVYLFEVASVTVSHTRALARVFRNRAGNYLLVLTSDYERLDFVLLDKYLPAGAGPGLGQRQVAIRPRTLTVERRKPERIHLRVLRRLSYTESDPFAQYEKLQFAYGVADWTEEHFNNKALFSDYYLLHRLPNFPEWSGDPKKAYQDLRPLYQGASSRLAGQPERVIRLELLEPLFGVLGFRAEAGKRAGSSAEEPDYRLCSAADPAKGDGARAPLALCLAYPWGRSLDGKDDQRDKDSPDENPGAVVVSLLEKGEAPWALVTNGKLWRLYGQQAHSKATSYYEIDLDEVLAHVGPQLVDPATAFRYFWILFRRQAFETAEVEREGKTVPLCLLDRLLLESEDYAKELGDRLKERVFEDIFPHLAKGFMAYLRQLGDEARGPIVATSCQLVSPPEDDSRRAHKQDAGTGDSQPALDTIFQGTLTLLYRLLFLLYAEARDLLPVREVRGYYDASLTKMKQEMARAAGPIADEVEANLKKHYRQDSCELYDRLARLFATVDRGEAALNVPIYNGGLFLTDPDDQDTTAEAENARFLNQCKVPDRFLARAIDLLARDIDSKREDLVFIDYKSLGVRQLGSIYEGLLEFRLRIAEEKMAVVKGKKTEEVVPHREAKAKKLRILTAGRGKSATERTIPKGEVYLENDKRERKATGSYYTPDHIVKYIVEHAVGPVIREKFESLRPKLREAQQKRDAFFKRQKALRQQGLKAEPESKADLIGQELVDELFKIKVLDPAMGSGHFLVEAVDFMTDKAIDFLNAFPHNPVFAHLQRMRETILKEMDDQGISIDAGRLIDVSLLKRHVLKRCIYGVDLNFMAVELAKVSLWLDCFTLGAPLSFLDHHLRCGNSLIGVTVKEVKEAIEGERSGKEFQWDLFGSHFAGLLLATDLMRKVGDLSDVTSAQVQESRKEYLKASDSLAPFKRILDVYTSQWFGNGGERKKRGKRPKPGESPALRFLRLGQTGDFLRARTAEEAQAAMGALSDADRAVAETARAAAREKRFFHWELEFPEVFYGPKPGTTQAIERLEGAGFDAVIGNPPYDVLASEELGYDVSQDLAFYESLSVYEPAIRGKKNLYKLFICRGIASMGAGGAFSFIVPMALLGDDQAAGVRRMLLEGTGLESIEAFPQKDDPRRRVFPEAKLSICVFVTRASYSNGQITLQTHPGHLVDQATLGLKARPTDILALDQSNVTIPSCTPQDWEIATRILDNANVRRLGDYCRAFQGEVNETTDGKKGFVSADPHDGPQILRGSTICLYVVREPSQGEAIYLRKRKYLAGKPDSVKAHHHEQSRVGWQESSPQNNFRRIIAALISKGEFCNHKINYFPRGDCRIPLDLVLAVLNSRISDWFFRLGSTNAAVSHYQIHNLPAPSFGTGEEGGHYEELLAKGMWEELARKLCAACDEPGVMPERVADALGAMSRRIQEIEAKRVLKSRSERSRLAPESQPIQDAIDAVLFRCYGLSEDDARYIDQRLKEML